MQMLGLCSAAQQRCPTRSLYLDLNVVFDPNSFNSDDFTAESQFRAFTAVEPPFLYNAMWSAVTDDPTNANKFQVSSEPTNLDHRRRCTRNEL